MRVPVMLDRAAVEKLVHAWQAWDDQAMRQGATALIRDLFDGQDGHLPVLEQALSTADYTPPGPIGLANTLGSFLPSGLAHPQLERDGQTIGQFQAERMLESGYAVVFAPGVFA